MKIGHSKPDIILKHEFVDFIPEDLSERTVYVSIRFSTVSHLCACGCKNKVVTPLRPTDWKLIFDGRTISLYPSIGNWNFPCRSHYWITNNRAEWASKCFEKEITEWKYNDSMQKFCDAEGSSHRGAIVTKDGAPRNRELEIGNHIWAKLKKWIWHLVLIFHPNSR